MRFHLKIWRQLDRNSKGQFEDFWIDGIGPDLSFLELMDCLNEDLIRKKARPVAFEHDCREGICGACSLIINGVPHGPVGATTTCQLYMRHFEEDAEITVEPWRAGPFKVIQDLVVDRSPFERILQAGGYVSVHTGEAPDANALLVSKEVADRAFEAANCIGCGACVAACPNASAMLFVAAKVTHLALLPQGQPEREHRVLKMVKAMDAEGIGNSSTHYQCADACPKQIPVSLIARLNREFLQSALLGREFGEEDHHCCHQE